MLIAAIADGASFPLTSSLPSAMPLNPETKYPTRRAYVVKVRGDAKPDAISGRLENLVTGRQSDFASGHELLDSIVRDLVTSAGEGSAARAVAADDDTSSS